MFSRDSIYWIIWDLRIKTFRPIIFIIFNGGCRIRVIFTSAHLCYLWIYISITESSIPHSQLLSWSFPSQCTSSALTTAHPWPYFSLQSCSASVPCTRVIHSNTALLSLFPEGMPCISYYQSPCIHTWWEAAARRIQPSSRETTNSLPLGCTFTWPPPNKTSGYTDTMLQSRMNTRLVLIFSWYTR